MAYPILNLTIFPPQSKAGTHRISAGFGRFVPRIFPKRVPHVRAPDSRAAGCLPGQSRAGESGISRQLNRRSCAARKRRACRRGASSPRAVFAPRLRECAPREPGAPCRGGAGGQLGSGLCAGAGHSFPQASGCTLPRLVGQPAQSKGAPLYDKPRRQFAADSLPGRFGSPARHVFAAGRVRAPFAGMRAAGTGRSVPGRDIYTYGRRRLQALRGRGAFLFPSKRVYPAPACRSACAAEGRTSLR